MAALGVTNFFKLPVSVPYAMLASKKASIKSAALDELFVPSCMKQLRRLHCFNVDDKRGMHRLIAQSSSEALAEESFATDEDIAATVNSLEFSGVHHVGVLCENLERSLEFYCGLLGLETNPNRPNSKLPYRGAWLNVGSEMIHLMELPNPDPTTGRPEQGAEDRHVCVFVKDLKPLKALFDKTGTLYTTSMYGRVQLFARDPDGNTVEFQEARK
ncbi:unnamed protein product [Sphagnum jensenii]|uniref:VOC domain-containing protein n=1 Tax=Sphagnum jensenii TaxID=128206 RepID=A0ABP1ACY9_9BRYO